VNKKHGIEPQVASAPFARQEIGTDAQVAELAQFRDSARR